MVQQVINARTRRQTTLLEAFNRESFGTMLEFGMTFRFVYILLRLMRVNAVLSAFHT